MGHVRWLLLYLHPSGVHATLIQASFRISRSCLHRRLQQQDRFTVPLLGHDALNTIYTTSLACSATVLCSLLLPPLDARPLSMAAGPDTLDTRIQIPVVAISEATDFLQHAWGSLAASTLSISSIHNRPSLRPLYFVHAWTVGHSLELPKASELGQIRIEDGKLRGCR